jgi:hypothetical protein
MKNLYQLTPQTLLTGLLLTILLLVGCVPIQPPSGTIPGATIPEPQGEAVILLTWEGAPLGEGPACAHLTVDANGQVAFGACDNIDQTATLGETHQRELDELQRRLAPFTAETASGTVAWNGYGAAASAAWQRAVATWAQLVYSELASGAASATGATAMGWVTGTAPEEPELCNQLTVLVYGYVYANTVPCDGGEVLASTGSWLNDSQLAQLDHWRTTLAPLYVEENYLAGNGTTEANAAEQRAIAAWAQLVYGEVSSGRASAAGATALSWFIDSLEGNGVLCQHLTVLSFGYAYAEIVPCAGGATVHSSGGPLTVEELNQLDAWLYTHEALYVENNYLAGTGNTPIPAEEVATVAAWATAVYTRLADPAIVAGGKLDLTTWSAYEADSGFVIYYPSDLYTVEVLASDGNSPFSGAIVFTPTATFNNREPLAQTYKLTILAHVASKQYSLSEPAALLANGRYLSYAPTLLAGRTITRTNLAGAPAVRVDDVPVGLAGAAIQLVAIRADIAYELIVEPSQASSSDPAADQANLALVEQMIDTFRFTR